MTTDTILAKDLYPNTPKKIRAMVSIYVDAINLYGGKPLDLHTQLAGFEEAFSRANAKATLLEPAFGEVVEALAEASSTLEILTHGLQHLTFMEVREKVHKALRAAAEVTKQLEGLK